METSDSELGLLEDERSRLPRWGKSTNTGGWESYQPPPKTESSNVTRRMPLIDGPLLPQNLGKPKNTLSTWYGKRHKNFVLQANACFLTWHDPSSSSHEKYFTSVFTCPLSGEKFMSGSFGDPKSMVRKEEKAKDGGEEQVTIVWCRKKKDAEHAAAARALDCFSYRDGNGVKSMSYGLCSEDPYLENEFKFIAPSSSPDAINDEVMTPLPLDGKEEVGFSAENKDVGMDDSDQFRMDYRSNRCNNEIKD